VGRILALLYLNATYIMPQFTVVYIPEDVTKPIEERTIEYTEDNKIPCLIDNLREHFRAIKPKDADKSQQIYADQVMSHAKAKGLKLPEEKSDMMAKLADVQMVDTVAVQLNHPDVDNIGVSVYCDDRAIAKGAEMNERATQFCMSAGWNQGVLGDAFIGRFKDDNMDQFERMDFKISDLDSSAAWIKGAREFNKRRAQPTNDPASGGATIRTMDVPESKFAKLDADARIDAAMSLKDKGNQYFKQGELDEAYAAYTEAIEALEAPAPLDTQQAMIQQLKGAQGMENFNAQASKLQNAEPPFPSSRKDHVETRISLHNNAALVKSKQRAWEDTAIHSTKAIALDPNNAKAFFRRGTLDAWCMRMSSTLQRFFIVQSIYCCLFVVFATGTAKRQQGMLSGALSDLASAYKLAPADKRIKKEYAATKKLADEKGITGKRGKAFKSGGLF